MITRLLTAIAILLLLSGDCDAFPIEIQYFDAATKTTKIQVMEVPNVYGNNSIFNELTGETIYIEANNLAMNNWNVKILEINGNWIKALGEDNKIHYINANMIQAFEVKK